METLLKELAKDLKVELNSKQIEMFLTYKELLQEWNQKMNLTAIIEDREIIVKHFIDSLTCMKYIQDENQVIDVGTGAGFPGVPIKIVNPAIQLTLLDSLKKRLVFLQEVLTQNKIEGVELVHNRAEEAGQNINYREKYDVAVSRAVANCATLVELCLPFVKVGGRFICMKGSHLEEVEEAKEAIKQMGGEIEKIEEVWLPESEIRHHIILIKKVKATPKQYPRKPGTPMKSPIL